MEFNDEGRDLHYWPVPRFRYEYQYVLEFLLLNGFELLEKNTIRNNVYLVLQHKINRRFYIEFVDGEINILFDNNIGDWVTVECNYYALLGALIHHHQLSFNLKRVDGEYQKEYQRLPKFYYRFRYLMNQPNIIVKHELSDFLDIEYLSHIDFWATLIKYVVPDSSVQDYKISITGCMILRHHSVGENSFELYPDGGIRGCANAKRIVDFFEAAGVEFEK